MNSNFGKRYIENINLESQRMIYYVRNLNNRRQFIFLPISEYFIYRLCIEEKICELSPFK